MELTISKTIYDVNSSEEKELIIFNRPVGTYNFGLYSRWYLGRMKNTGRTIPDVGRFVCGLLCREFNIDINNVDALISVENNIKEQYKDIGKWFEERILKSYDKN